VTGGGEVINTQTCKQCGLDQPSTEFYAHSGHRLRTDCKTCTRERTNRHYHGNRDAINEVRAQNRRERSEEFRNYYREKRQAVTPDQFQALFEQQRGLCAICRSEDRSGRRTLAVDHDHACCPTAVVRKTCGKCVRRLLCDTCNRALGMFADNPEWLIRAAAYVKLGLS